MDEKILIVDAETTVSNFIKKIIEYDKTNKVICDIVNTIDEFKNKINATYSIIIIDINFPGINVYDFIAKYAMQRPDVSIIATAATIDINTALTCIRSGAYDFISKPFTSDTILLVVKNALEKRQLIKEKELLNNDIQMINDELTKANKLISAQKEQIDNYLKQIMNDVEKVNEFSIALNQIKSIETNINNIGNSLNKIFEPYAYAILLYDERQKNYIVKKEKKMTSSFPIGIQIEADVFSKYFKNSEAMLSSELTSNKETFYSVILPIVSGKMKLGIIIMEIEKERYNEMKLIFFQIIKFIITESILNSKFFEDSQRSYIESLMAFLLLQEKIHKGIKKHSELIAAYAVKLAKKMNLPDNEIRNIKYAGLLHLLGLVIVPNDKLNAENYFDKEKKSLIKNAVLEGAQILSPLVYLSESNEIIKNLFENYDGTGIPEGKMGAKIPISARILRVVSDYVTFTKIFKMDKNEVKNYFNKQSGKIFDPEVIKELFNIIKKH